MTALLEATAGTSLAWRSLLLKKLQLVGKLSDGEHHGLDRLPHDTRTIEHLENLQAAPGTMAVVAAGWCFRYRHLLDGRRVIFNFWLPGDLINLSIPLAAPASGIAAWRSTKIVLIADTNYRKLCDESPALVAAIAANERLDALLLANQVLRLSRLTAYERVAHFLLEHWERSAMVGLTHDNEARLPLTQEILADALGLTHFHVSRTLTRLRADRLVSINRQSFTLHDVPRTMEMVEYEPVRQAIQNGLL